MCGRGSSLRRTIGSASWSPGDGFTLVTDGNDVAVWRRHRFGDTPLYDGGQNHRREAPRRLQAASGLSSKI
jgi:hypothetical protein